MHASVQWQGKMKFVGSGDGEGTVVLDAPTAVGGEGAGMRPKELMLHALAGCTAMDVISILGKMQTLPESFSVEVTTEETEEHPRVFTKAHLVYHVTGAVPEEKLKRAVELSQERYCGVSAMFRQFAELSYEYRIDG